MKKANRQLYGRLLGYVRPYWRIFAGGILAMIVLALTEPAVAAILKPILDGTVVQKDMQVVTKMAMLLVLIYTLRGLSNYISVMALTWVGGKLVMDLRAAVFNRLIHSPASFFDHQTSGRLISRVTYDAQQVQEASTFVVTVVVRDALAITGLVAWMCYLNWRLALVALLVTPPVVFVVRFFSRRLRKVSTGLQDAMGSVTHGLEESIAAHRMVRAYGGQRFEQHRFAATANRVRRYQMKFAAAAEAISPITQCLTALALAIVIVIAARHLTEGTITVGGFVSFFAAMAFLSSPLRRLTMVNSALQRGLAAAESLFGVLDMAPEQNLGTRTLDHPAGVLDFEQLSFAYDSRPEGTLFDINLHVAAGETVALVGPSGSGKSTLISLIPRFYHPDKGRICLDGIDLRELELGSLRSRIALVSQDTVLFDDTVAANIAYGPLAGTARDAIEAAVEAANASDFVARLPQGLDTRIGERGTRLSGGQCQRLAIARAFLKDAPVLILDEATSALDTESERAIQEALARLRRNRTTIVIAHRLSTIKHADRIAVMHGGRILATGKHQELMAGCSLYAGLYRFQFAARDDEEAAA